MLVDTTAPTWGALWELADPGTVRSVRRTANHCSLVVDDQRWTFALPGPVLRYRTDLTAEGEVPDPLVQVSPQGKSARILLESASNTLAVTCWHISLRFDGNRPAELYTAIPNDDLDEGVPTMVLDEERCAAAIPADRGRCCHLVRIGDSESQVVIRLRGATHVAMRLSGSHWTLADDRGRFVVVDVHTGTLIRNARISG